MQAASRPSLSCQRSPFSSLLCVRPTAPRKSRLIAKAAEKPTDKQIALLANVSSIASFVLPTVILGGVGYAVKVQVVNDLQPQLNDLNDRLGASVATAQAAVAASSQAASQAVAASSQAASQAVAASSQAVAASSQAVAAVSVVALLVVLAVLGTTATNNK